MGISRTSYKPGQTGNPNGQPRKGNTYREILNRMAEARTIDLIIETKQYNPKSRKEEVIKRRINLKTGGKAKSIKEAEAAVMHSKFLSGDAKFAQLIMDRAEGKAVQPLEHTGQMAIDYYFDVLKQVEDEEKSSKKKKR